MRQTQKYAFNLMSLAIVLVMILLKIGGVAYAENTCYPVSGRFHSQIVPCETFCTDGQLTGALNGDYTFTQNLFFPTGEQDIQTVFFYTGQSDVATHRGHLTLIDSGALDVATGNISALLTVTEGSEYYAGASGYLHVYGAANLVTGFADGRYEGEICVE